MSVLLACPTRGRVWFETAMGLAELAQELGVQDFLYVNNNRSVVDARGQIMQAFLDGEYGTLLMVDDDIIPSPDLLRIVDTLRSNGEAGIVGAPCPIIRPGLPVVPNIYKLNEEKHEYAIDLTMTLDGAENPVVEVDGIGFGAVAISRSLAMTQPTFQNRYDEKTGEIYMGEDLDYCLRAKAKGYKTLAQMDMLCDHRVEMSAAGVASILLGFLDKIQSS